jgi:dipeptidyl aminopeptidase/acylaminoacyl peptidase
MEERHDLAASCGTSRVRMLRFPGPVFLVSAIVALLAVVLVGAGAGRAGTEGRVGTIAFLRFSPGAWKSGTGGALFVIQADGSGLRQLTPPGEEVDSYQWSPDGRRIAYLDSKRALWVVRPDGAGRRFLAAASRLRSPYELAWSPDGKAIAVLASATPQSPSKLIVIPTDGGRSRRLPTGDVGEGSLKGDVEWFSWAARTDEIAYGTSGRTWAIRGDGRDRHPLHLYDFWGGAWSPNGSLLGLPGQIHVPTLLPRTQHDPQAGLRDFYGGIYVADANGSDLRLVTGNAYNEYGFAWSPNGRSILYGRANSGGIYVIDADGQNDHEVTGDPPPKNLVGSTHVGARWTLDRIRHTPDRERRHLRDRRRRPQQDQTHELTRRRRRPLLGTPITRTVNCPSVPS